MGSGNSIWVSGLELIFPSLAMLDMQSPAILKEVQKLTDCRITLGRFISKSANKYVPFFKV